MMARRLGKETFTIRRAPLVTDPRDNTSYRDWSQATDTVIKDSMVQPFLLSEKLQYEQNRDREYSRSGFRFWAPAGTDVEYTDRIIYRGQEYDVLGQNGVWVNFSGVEDHVSFIAQIREG